MKCSYCGFENPEKSKFCGKCGKALGIEPEYPAELQVKSYLQKVIQRLRNGGYDIYENETYNDYSFRYVATTRDFKLPLSTAEAFFLFAVFPSIDIYSLGKFITNCFEYAWKTRNPSLWKATYNFPIAIVNSIDRDTSAYIRNKAMIRKTNVWGMPIVWGMPVVYDLKFGTLHCREKWGWGKIRETVKILLAP